MALADELERLAALRQSGELNDVEYSAAKMRLLSAENAPAGDAPSGANLDETFGRAANRYVSFQIVMSLVGLAIFAAVFFGVVLPRMQAVDRQMPAMFEQMDKSLKTIQDSMPKP